jgi:hypothetical protein
VRAKEIMGLATYSQLHLKLGSLKRDGAWKKAIPKTFCAGSADYLANGIDKSINH